MSAGWVAMARDLGLVAHYAYGSVLNASGWQDLLHFVGEPIPGLYRYRPFTELFMVGSWRGSPVLVLGAGSQRRLHQASRMRMPLT